MSCLVICIWCWQKQNKSGNVASLWPRESAFNPHNQCASPLITLLQGAVLFIVKITDSVCQCTINKNVSDPDFFCFRRITLQFLSKYAHLSSKLWISVCIQWIISDFCLNISCFGPGVLCDFDRNKVALDTSLFMQLFKPDLVPKPRQVSEIITAPLKITHFITLWELSKWIIKIILFFGNGPISFSHSIHLAAA